jgi:hypothetical protein
LDITGSVTYCFTAPTDLASLPKLPGTLNDSRLAYLQGHGMGELLTAMQEATISTLQAKQRPLRRLAIPRVDEEVLGALFMHSYVGNHAGRRSVGRECL